MTTNHSSFDSDVPSNSHLIKILDFANELGASDIHLCSGSPITIRLNGELEKMGDFADGLKDIYTPEEVSNLIFEIMTDEEKRAFAKTTDMDFSINLTGGDRVRVNLFRNIYGICAVFRIIPSEIPDLEKLGIPAIMKQVITRSKGLILVTGPTGSGKSTTLASLINYINYNSSEHIITIEDPVEFIHKPQKSLINQREIGRSATTFAEALRGALREDPDVILVGEMRDLETISTALTAAETGHLVLGTLHTMSAIKTIDRIINEFPSEQQNQIRMQISESLTAVISQILIKRADKPGRVAAFEILISTQAVRNLIRENKTYQINSVIQTGMHLGMMSLDQHLSLLVNSEIISPSEARKYATEPKMFPDRATTKIKITYPEVMKDNINVETLDSSSKTISN